MAPDSMLERNAEELAMEVVSPAVIKASEGLPLATCFHAEERALVRAAVNHRLDAAFLIADDDDRSIADVRGPITAGFRNFSFEAQIIPHGSAKDVLLFPCIDLRV